MHDAFNRAIDQLEAAIGIWLRGNPGTAVAIAIGLGVVIYAYKIYVLDHRS